MTTPHHADADQHAVLVAADQSLTPSGCRLTGPVDSAEKLGELIAWVRRRGGLQPIGTQLPQVWILDVEACAALDWAPAGENAPLSRTDLTRRVAASAAALIERGWALSGAGSRVRLAHKDIGEFDVIIAPFADVLMPPEASAGEVGRILSQWAARFGVLPGMDGAECGAAIENRIRRAKTKGLVVRDPGAVPSIVGDLATGAGPAWSRPLLVEDIDDPGAEFLVELNQLAGPLASAGMLALPAGDPTVVSADHARELAAGRKLPAALWQITLPPANGLQLPEKLPLPDPRMRADEPVTVWVTTSGLIGLSSRISDGGTGLDIAQLGINAAVTWPEQGRALAAWTDELRDARHAWVDDVALLDFVDATWSGYLAHLAYRECWHDKGGMQHLQPVWLAAIVEETRFRGRRAAMGIADRYRVWPLMVDDVATTLVYAVAPGQDLSEPAGRLGKLNMTVRVDLPDETIMELFLAEDRTDTVITALLGHDDPSPTPAPTHSAARPEPQLDESTSPAATETVSDDKGTCHQAMSEAVSSSVEPDIAAAEPVPGTGGAAESASARPVKTMRRPEPADAECCSGPAAVLDVDGAWLGDGTRIDLPAEIAHVGDLARFAQTLRLGHRISPTFTESGQIWITNELAEQFGIDVDAVGARRTRADDLRKLTADLPFFTGAREAGWKFGGQRDDATSGLSGWTRVWHDDVPTVWVVFLAGLTDDPDTDDPDMPVLEGNPEPAVLARRLKRLADTLGYPYKISGPTTGMDLVFEARPSTYGPKEWREKIWAPSTFDPPAGAGMIANDIEWTRTPTPEESTRRWVHAYDRGGSYTAGLPGLELPIGAPVHHDEWEFDPRVPAYILTRIPPAQTWLLPHVLSPSGRDFGDSPQWVCTPQFERALALGYELPIYEAWVWPEHGRILRDWANRFSRAAKELDTDDADDQAVRKHAKMIRVRGYGMIGSQQLIGDDGKPRSPYSREKWLMGVSKTTANIVYALNNILEQTGEAPLAITKDTIVFASNDPNPLIAWPMAEIDTAAAAENPKHRATLGRAFGQWKPEASGLLADQLKFFDGGPYKGKRKLTRYADWNATSDEGEI
ncbi:hypothetical protein [Nocardia salmonicida]|uniref:hypothetical protein n=1 Tax=Nocardia salmonicida TaxID=53431 RepID=UPI0007C70687|nr:hypothetical protein [Nocardia salmonicida]MBC7299535.1 hypothetical protein [Nocardia sp.]